MSDDLKEHARINLDFGAKFPYDAPDKWDDTILSLVDLLPPKDWAHRAARGIISDLMDRRDIKFGFHGVDEETRREIVETMAEIIRQGHPARDWVSVEEALPEHPFVGWTDYVLVLMNGDEWFKAAGYFSGGELLYWETYEAERHLPIEQVTHWMRIELP